MRTTLAVTLTLLMGLSGSARAEDASVNANPPEDGPGHSEAQSDNEQAREADESTARQEVGNAALQWWLAVFNGNIPEAVKGSSTPFLLATRTRTRSDRPTKYVSSEVFQTEEALSELFRKIAENSEGKDPAEYRVGDVAPVTREDVLATFAGLAAMLPDGGHRVDLIHSRYGMRLEVYATPAATVVAVVVID